jgi:hypothetical protein
MKYFKKFDGFIKTNEAFTSDHDFSIVDLFSPLFKTMGNLFNKAKLESILSDYDNYLTSNYNEYMKTLKPVEKIGVEDTSTDKDINVVDNKDEIVGDDGVKDTGYIKPPEIIKSPIKINKSSDLDTREDIEMMNDCEEQIQELYETGDVESAIKIMNSNSRDMQYSLKMIQKAKDNIKPFKQAKDKASKNLLKFKMGSLEYDQNKTIIDNANKEIAKHESKIEEENKKYMIAKWAMEQFRNNIEIIKNKPVVEPVVKPVNESEILPKNEFPKWDKKNMDELKKKINPFVIDEYFIKADIILNASKNDKLKSDWSLMLNELSKKWYFVYGDIRSLKNPNSSSLYDNNNDKKELTIGEIVIETIYPSAKKYTHPFDNLKNSSESYFIVENISSVFLLKKVVFDLETGDNIFFIIGNIINRNNKLNIEYIFDKTKHKSLKVIINDNKIEIFNNDNPFPVFIENKGSMIYNDRSKTITLKNTNIFSIIEKDFKKLLLDSGISKFDPPIVDDEYIEKIKSKK